MALTVCVRRRASLRRDGPRGAWPESRGPDRPWAAPRAPVQITRARSSYRRVERIDRNIPSDPIDDDRHQDQPDPSLRNEDCPTRPSAQHASGARQVRTAEHWDEERRGRVQGERRGDMPVQQLVEGPGRPAPGAIEARQHVEEARRVQAGTRGIDGKQQERRYTAERGRQDEPRAIPCHVITSAKGEVRPVVTSRRDSASSRRTRPSLRA